MSSSGSAASGGVRLVRVPPERLAGWIERFGVRHGPYEVSVADRELVLRARDESVAALALPLAAPGHLAVPRTIREFMTEALEPRTVGLLVIRKGGYSVGVANGTDVFAHRTGSRYVQGRTAAGGSSQQRFARRRANQTTAAFAEAHRAVADVVLPHVKELDGVVAGGDRNAVRSVLEGGELAAVRALLRPTMAPVGDAKRVALDVVLGRARDVEIRVTDVVPGSISSDPAG